MANNKRQQEPDPKYKAQRAYYQRNKKAVSKARSESNRKNRSLIAELAAAVMAMKGQLETLTKEVTEAIRNPVIIPVVTLPSTVTKEEVDDRFEQWKKENPEIWNAFERRKKEHEEELKNLKDVIKEDANTSN